MLAELPTKEKVRNLIDQGLTVREIARLLDISTQAVYQHLETLQLPAPSKRDEVS